MNNTFYGNCDGHPEGGSEMIKINGKWYPRYNLPEKPKPKPIIQHDNDSPEDRLIFLLQQRDKLQSQLKQLNKLIDVIQNNS